MIKVDWVIISGVFKCVLSVKRHGLFLRFIVYCLFITRNWSFCAAVFNIYGFFLSFVCLPV